MKEYLYTIYTQGGGEIMFNILNAIASFHNDKGIFERLCNLAVVIGMFSLGFILINRNQILEAVKKLIFTNVLLTSFFIPTAPVMVHDTITKFEFKVDNVPLPISVVGGILSELSHSITEAFETSFSTLNENEYYQNSGMIFGATLMAEIKKFKISDPIFKHNLNKFTQQCIVTGAMIGRYSMNTLNSTDDIWSYVKEYAPKSIGMPYIKYTKETKSGNSTFHSKTVTELLSCKDAAQEIDLVWNREINNIISNGITLIFPFLGYANDISNSFTKSKLAEKKGNEFIRNNMNSFLNGISSLQKIALNSENLIKQQMMINEIIAAPKEKIEEDGSSLNYATSRAIVQHRMGILVSIEQNARNLPILKAVFEGLLYASLPFVMLIVLGSSSIKFLQTYFTSLLSLHLWAPLYAILNMMMTTTGDFFTSGFLGGKGLTILTSAGLSEINTNIACVAGLLSVCIPPLSYMLIHSGLANLVHLSSSITGQMQSAASQAGAELATGNISTGNITQGVTSLSNFSGFKMDQSSSFRGAQIETQMNDGAYKLMQSDGSMVFKAGAGLTSSQGINSVELQDSVTGEISRRLDNEKGLITNLSKAHSNEKIGTFNALTEFYQGLAKGESSGNTWNIDTSTSHGKTLAQGQELVRGLQKQFGMDTVTASKVAAGLTMDASAGINSSGKGKSVADNLLGGSPFNFNASLGANLHGGLEMSDQAIETYRKSKEFQERNGYNINLESMVHAAKNMSYGNNSTFDTRLSDNLSKSYTKQESTRQSLEASIQNVERLSNAVSFVNSSGATITRNADQEVLEFIAHKNNGNMDEAYNIMEKEPELFKAYANEYIGTQTNKIINEANKTTLPSSHSLDSKYEDFNVGQIKNDYGLSNHNEQTFDEGVNNTHIKDTIIEVGAKDLAEINMAAHNDQLGKKNINMNKEKHFLEKQVDISNENGTKTIHDVRPKTDSLVD
ncbi:MAG: conjugal transfer protein TraG N-terminal domain-containing protein [Sphingobacteriia bacterium]|nr:conjugal transfer protein TraG N-terminal domain-containing protein [Sphingobacteriia bacterium]